MNFIYNIIFNLSLIRLINSENQINYYDDLITTRIERSYKYRCPHDNSRFFEYSSADNDTVTDHEEFDFIICGAGAAGAIIASRLSEVKNWKILLLEAGDYEDDFSDIPFSGAFECNSDRNWCYKGYRYSKSVFKIPYVRGKSIGGSTAINGLMYTRGNKEDYVKWAALGNPGWSYDDVEPYFRKLEKSYIPNDENYLGKSGSMPISYTELVNISAVNFYTKLFVNGAKELNIDYNNNYNGVNQLGISHTQYNKLFGKRMSTGRAYLDKAKQHKSLKIITKSLVTKILLSKNNTAYGLQFMKNGRMFSVYARKEVIISAGAINSPQLLMLSGIGPKNLLNKLNITVASNLPVGKNIIDQYAVLIPLKTNYKEKVKLFKRKEIQYFLDGKGVLTNWLFSNDDIILFYNSKANASWPEAEFIFSVPSPFLLNPYKQSQPLSFGIILAASILLHPKSRGEITLQSSNPKHFPKINFRMFSDPEDILTFYENIKLVKKLTSTQALKEYNTKILRIPGLCDLPVFNDKKYWECFIKTTAIPFLHMIGSNRMGADPKSSVVNNELKVHGIKNLRVADASIIPVSISGHTSAPSMMVGEKAADIIKLSHNIVI